MSAKASTIRPLVAWLALGLSFGATASHASDPLPSDTIAPPADVNIALFYNEFTNAGAFGSAGGGGTVSRNTHISTNILVGRYIRTFDVAGLLSGVDVFEEYVSFIGSQHVGIGNIPAGALGSLGPGYGALSAQSGFGQSNIGIFTFPVDDAATGTYLVFHPWIAPPISSFNRNAALNPAQDGWTYEMEAGLYKTLIGAPTARNLAISLWGEAYLFSPNHDSADVSPTIFADNIPPLASFLGVRNPVQASSALPASFHEQPSEELRVYLPYEFYPATAAVIAPGLFQSFGGKQTYTLSNGVTVDSGNRTNETQLRLVASSFVSPTVNVTLVGEYDVANHGGPLQRALLLRVAKFF
ncbi:MAG TPA: hypothetical protein VNC39_08590 [Acidocella sp.]|jgi:hypothetical protein|uniref:hypothetical protein n=1 Tax=Acidocella sp. TaxID=50710 RepID=UPI002C4A4F22|nr:hypothetical protein [Acidocella sp.]HVE22021.1 hypothetical protein [Acidocella sp.]